MAAGTIYAAGITFNVIPFSLTTKDGNAIAEWSIANATNGSYSAHLETTGIAGSGNEARVVIQASDIGITTLNDLQTISWNAKGVVGYTPHVDVYLDNGKTLVFEYAKVDPLNCDNSAGYPTGDVNTFGDKGIVNNSAYAWLSSGAPGPCGDPAFDENHNSLTDWKITDGSAGILRFEIEVDNWIPSLANSVAYVDAIEINGTTYYGLVQDAISAASSGDTISIAAGTYVESGQIHIDKNLTIAGNSGNKAVIQPGVDFLGTDAAGSWWLIDSGVTLGLSNVVLDGGSHWVNRGLRSHGNTTINSVDFLRIRGSLSGQPYSGIAVMSFGGTVPGGAGSDTHGAGGANASLTVTNSTFSDIGRVGVLIKGTGSTATLTGNTYTGKGNGDFLDYGFEAGAGGSVTITGNNTITGNRGIVINGNGPGENSTSAGILITDYYGAGTSASVNGNTFSNNTAGVHVGYLSTDASNVTAHENDFSGESVGIESDADTVTVNAENNWWGTYASSTIATHVVGLVDFDPWYVDSGKTNLSNIPLTITLNTLNGDDTTTMYVWTANGFTDPGVTATGPLVQVTTSGSVNDDVPGTYTLTYTATDIFGNTASITRTVKVQASSGGGGSRGRSSGAASPRALQAVNAAGVTLPAPAARVIGQVLGVTIVDEPARQAAIASIKSQIVSLIQELLGLLRAQLAAAIQAGN